MTFDETKILTGENENEPEQKSPEEFAKEFLNHLENNPNSNNISDEMFSYVLYWKINIKGFAEDQVQPYFEELEKNFSLQLDKYHCISFYVPTLEEPTSLTLVNAKTMKYVKM